MFTVRFQKATHTRLFTISDPEAFGWEVREERDDELVRVVRYLDWHRVERARMEFAREAAALREYGWVEVRESPFGESATETH